MTTGIRQSSGTGGLLMRDHDGNNNVCCGTPSSTNDDDKAVQCACGNVFKEDAIFCRRCGARRLEETADKVQGDRKSIEKKKADKAVFVDANAMKAAVREAMYRPKWDVMDFYHDTGCWQAIARHRVFDNLTLFVISLNAVWIWIEADYNHHDLITSAEWYFQVGANGFCSFFSLEWLIRVMAFKNKINCRKDLWLMFDSCLVATMVLETWLTPLLIYASSGSIQPGQGLAGTAVMRIMRIFRLTRMARMVRLLRAMPELRILIKGMATAMRSVFFTLCLMLVIIYVYALAFRQLTMDDTTSGIAEQYFNSIPESMLTLLVYGTLLDEVSQLVFDIRGAQQWHLLFLLLSFILLAALTVMNMLVGVLCEVVNAVAAVEKEELLVGSVHSKLMEVVNHSLTEEGEVVRKDQDLVLSRKQFDTILTMPEAVRALQEVGVDVVGLVDYTDMIFPSGKPDQGSLSFRDFMDIVLQLRGTNTATVKDVVDLRKALTVYFDNKAISISDSVEKQISKAFQKQMNNTANALSTALSSSATVDKMFPEAVHGAPRDGLTQSSRDHAGGVTHGDNLEGTLGTVAEPDVEAPPSEAGKGDNDIPIGFHGKGEDNIAGRSVLATLDDLKEVRAGFLKALKSQTDSLKESIEQSMLRNLKPLAPFLDAAAAAADSQRESAGETGGTSPPVAAGVSPMFPPGSFQFNLGGNLSSGEPALAVDLRRQANRVEQAVEQGVNELHRIDRAFRVALEELQWAAAATVSASSLRGLDIERMVQQRALSYVQDMPQRSPTHGAAFAGQTISPQRSPTPAAAATVSASSLRELDIDRMVQQRTLPYFQDMPQRSPTHGAASAVQTISPQRSPTPASMDPNAERLPVLVMPKHRPPDGPPPTPPPMASLPEALHAEFSSVPPIAEGDLRFRPEYEYCGQSFATSSELCPYLIEDATSQVRPYLVEDATRQSGRVGDSLQNSLPTQRDEVDIGLFDSESIASANHNQSRDPPPRPDSRFDDYRPFTPQPTGSSGGESLEPGSREPSFAKPASLEGRPSASPDCTFSDARCRTDAGVLPGDEWPSSEGRDWTPARPDSRVAGLRPFTPEPEANADQQDLHVDEPGDWAQERVFQQPGGSRLDQVHPQPSEISPPRPESRFGFAAEDMHRPDGRPHACGVAARDVPLIDARIYQDVATLRPDSRMDDFLSDVARPESGFAQYYTSDQDVPLSRPDLCVEQSLDARADSRFEQYALNVADMALLRPDSLGNQDSQLDQDMTESFVFPLLQAPESQQDPSSANGLLARPDRQLDSIGAHQSVQSTQLQGYADPSAANVLDVDVPLSRPESRLEQRQSPPLRPNSRVGQMRPVSPEPATPEAGLAKQRHEESSWFSPTPMVQTLRPMAAVASRGHPKPRLGEALPLDDVSWESNVARR